MKKINLFSTIIGLSLPFITLAATSDTSQGLPGIDLTIQRVFDIFKGLACYLSRFVMILMVVVLIWYGIQMLLSRGNPTKFGDARKALGYAIIGVVVVLGSYTIISTVGNAVQSAGTPGSEASNQDSDSHWYDYLPIDCSNSII